MVLMLAASTSHLTCPSVWMLAASTSHPTCSSLLPPPLPTSSRCGCWQRLRLILPVPLFLFLLLISTSDRDADAETSERVDVSPYLARSPSSFFSAHFITIRTLPGAMSHPTCPSLLPPPPLLTSSRYGCWYRLRLTLPVPLFLLLLCPLHHDTDVGRVYVSPYLCMTARQASHLVMCFASLERLRAVFRPLHVKEFVLSRHALVVTVLIYVFSAICHVYVLTRSPVASVSANRCRWSAVCLPFVRSDP